jgi:elongation factor G
MSQSKVQDIRNIVFCGHGSAGKTTLADAILTRTGAIKRPASVADGTSICDFDDEEKVHKNTLESTLVHFDHAGKHFNLIDTPGYPDFIAQVLGPMQAVDTAAIVIDAHAGLGVNTRRVFNEAGKQGLGRVVIITKMDADNVDYPALLNTVQELFGKA